MHGEANVPHFADKDYQLAARPSPADVKGQNPPYGKVLELASVKDFSNHMESRGILEWWRKAMGYT